MAHGGLTQRRHTGAHLGKGDDPENRSPHWSKSRARGLSSANDARDIDPKILDLLAPTSLRSGVNAKRNKQCQALRTKVSWAVCVVGCRAHQSTWGKEEATNTANPRSPQAALLLGKSAARILVMPRQLAKYIRIHQQITLKFLKLQHGRDPLCFTIDMISHNLFCVAGRKECYAYAAPVGLLIASRWGQVLLIAAIQAQR